MTAKNQDTRRSKTADPEGSGAHNSAPDTVSPAVETHRKPREIVVYCEGFGGGPGMGWFYEASFVEMNAGGYSIFLRADLDYPLHEILGLPDPEENRDEEEEEEDWGEEEEDSTPVYRVKTVNEPLDCRGVLRFLLKTEYLRFNDVSADINVDGAEPWEEDLIRNLLLRRGLASFLMGLPDRELAELYARTGGLGCESNRLRLKHLAQAVREAGLRKMPLEQIAARVGAPDWWNLPALTAAVRAYAQTAGSAGPR